jgi:quercetin dioxygenase-like cupin family protein
MIRAVGIFSIFLAVGSTFAQESQSSERSVVFVDTQNVPWQPVEGVEGAQWKLIRTDPVNGGITALVQFPAKAIEKPHHHTHGHMIYIIDGAKTVKNLTTGKDFQLSQGMYLYTPAGNVHQIQYLTRCTFLFVTDGPFDMIWDSK